MGMLDLPLEILLQILDELPAEANINALAKPCWHLYTLLNPIFYQRNIQNGQSSALLWAVRENQEATVLKCLEQGASISLPPPERKVSDDSDSDDDDSEYAAAACALHPLVCIAAEKGYDSILRILLEHGANPNGENWYPHLPLSLAIENRHDAAMHLLLDHADIELNPTRTRDAMAPPLFFALRLNSLEIVRDHRGARVDLAERQYRIGSLSWRALLIATASGSRPLVELLIQHGGCDPKERYNAVFHQAARFGYWHLFEYFAALGVDPNSTDEFEKGATAISATDHDGRNPLDRALSNGWDDCAELLLRRWAQPNTEFKDEPPLVSAAWSGLLKVTRYLLEIDSDANCVAGEDGWTPLICAAQNDTPDIARLLLESGRIDGIDARDVHGSTALCAAAAHGCPETADLLLKYGACLETRDEEGQTPLSLAAESNGTEMIRFLLDVGAEINSRDHQGWTPLFHAAHNNLHVYDLLLERGADPDVKDGNGNTAASEIGDSDVRLGR
ncbi:ankyrin repeat-containing domain protein [Aspergillus keveii]|uniref:Ankyrin repeat-containing domain protein n=1 Tax=Aspergillus keveii TaxID=714993 RepID=A0ABR4GML2_9EURO